MKHAEPHEFAPLPAGPSGIVTWIHLGDLHMTKAGEQNEIDLGRIVDHINAVYADGSVQFVFLPGDIADDGSAGAYQTARSHLDRLQIPWCGIVGDHDVQEGSFHNFKEYIANDLYSAFSIDAYRFLRLNAFSEPKPDSFMFDKEQQGWLEKELQQCESGGMRAVLLLHCYPSDLKQGGEALTHLVRRYPVLLIDMGHTHYNEISNDGLLLYSATRSTGQIEEGPVGFSVLSLDADAVSWSFVEPGASGLVQITQPADDRLQTYRSSDPFVRAPDGVHASTQVRAKLWSRKAITRAEATLGGAATKLKQEGGVWSGQISTLSPTSGVHRLNVTATDDDGQTITAAIELSVVDDRGRRARSPVDQENAIGAWPERGILGTQLGPNKNGRQW